MSAVKLFRILCVGLIVTSGLALPRAMSQQTLINEKLDKVAELLVSPLASEDVRRFIWLETRASRNREQMLDLEETVKNAPKSTTGPASLGPWTALDTAIADLKKAVAGPGPAAAGAPPVSFQFYFPVPEHRQEWDGSLNLLVASSPSGDEKTIKSITAYYYKADGSVATMELDPNKPPVTPTIMIANDDHRSMDLTFPMVASVDDLPQESALTVGGPADNSFIGMPKIRILDDHEPWYRGDPEIYVEVTQWYGGAARVHTVDLPGVNDEYKWYYLGDGPGSPTCFYFDLGFDRLTLFRFYEADSPDDDDYLGERYVNRITDLPYYDVWYLFSAGDAQFRAVKHR